MYAIIETGGKQYRVSPGNKVRVEKINADVGANIQIDSVLLVSGEETLIGTPHVESMPVHARVISHGRGDKIRVIKMKRRKNYRRTQGHRQDYSELEILGIGELPEPEPKVGESALKSDETTDPKQLEHEQAEVSGDSDENS